MRKSVPAAFITGTAIGKASRTPPSPKADTKMSAPMPAATPNRHGRPRRQPTLAPTAVSMTLLGPGVPAATACEDGKGDDLIEAHVC